MFSSIVLLVTACIAAVVHAQTPPGYTPNTTVPLYLKYDNYPVVAAGSVLPYNQPSSEPALYASKPLNGTYILFIVDVDNNKSAPIPGKLLYLASGVQFSTSSPVLISRSLAAYPAITANSSQVPYLAPSVPGNRYVTFLYQSPPSFAFPPNFPYNATFRSGFNTTRIGADFKSPLLEATYFELKSNALASSQAPYPTPTSTPGYVVAGGGSYPSGTATAVSGYGGPTGSGGYVTTVPFTGGAGKSVGRSSLWMVGAGVIGVIVGQL